MINKLLWRFRDTFWAHLLFYIIFFSIIGVLASLVNRKDPGITKDDVHNIYVYMHYVEAKKDINK
jgi:hypothetical protein